MFPNKMDKNTAIAVASIATAAVGGLYLLYKSYQRKSDGTQNPPGTATQTIEGNKSGAALKADNRGTIAEQWGGNNTSAGDMIFTNTADVGGIRPKR